jgi:cytochrome c oxidase cbb3-type subunit IV
MFAEYLKSIPGIEILGIAGLLLTFTAFVVIVIWAARADKNYIREMSQLPLDDNSAAEHHLTER